MQDWKDFGFAENVTRSLRIHWSSPFGGRRILVGPGPTRMRPGGTRVGQGNRPFAAGRPRVTMGSYNRIVQEAGISFHGFGFRTGKIAPGG
jgi:hypothetical protein